ncbi:MAG: nucleotide exchange factor GrpE [Deltaproteobacteria bacterium]|nr:nucleotide exchange factor GrpE [Deltaproteobacteria bacterium]
MNDNFSENGKKIDIKVDEPETVDNINTEKDAENPAEVPLEQMSSNDLIKKIDELKEESKENYDKYLRSQAEIDNIIKRNKKEKEEWIKYSNEALIKDLLQVIDNLENAINHSRNENSFNALIEGVELTLKGFKDTLAKSGLEEVKTLGEDFDPCFHHAVQEEMSDSVEKGKILKEFQKGYTLNQRLIRPAMVVISKGDSNDYSQPETFQGACEE